MSKLLQILMLLFSMQDDDITALSAKVLDQRKQVWIDTLNEQARRYGCNRASANPPRKNNLRDLKRMSDKDAKGIARTYNRDLERELKRLYAANPRGNRNYYYKNVNAWITRRNVWKSVQIALMTEGQTREYAKSEFYRNNDLRGRYIFVGPPPVCDDCARLFAMGQVSETVVGRYPNPQHVNCLHAWQLVTGQRVDCRDVWVG